MNTQTINIVRVYSGDGVNYSGFCMGGQLENDFGTPLTRREALKIARDENERSKRRRDAGNMAGNFYYVADSFSR